MKKFVCILITTILISLLFINVPPTVHAAPEGLTDIDLEYTTLPTPPNISSQKAIILDNTTGTILYAKGSQTAKLYPASITKILTAIVVMDNIDDPEETVTKVSTRATNLSSGSSVMGLIRNDQITVKDLLYGLLLKSGNDAALALAECVAGSVNGFVELMNEKAKELGAKNSHFKNPHGLQNADHYTCLYDIALFAHELTKYPLLSKIVKSGSYTAHITRNNRNIVLELENTNQFLIAGNKYYSKYYTGLKTGTTNAAGYCLSVRYQKNNKDIIALTFNGDPEKYYDEMKELVEYAESSFTTINLKDIYSARDFSVQVQNATIADINNGNLALRIDSVPDKTYVTTSSLANALRNATDPVKVVLPDNISAPVYAGDNVGKITIYLGSQILMEGDLTATRTVLDHLEVPDDLALIAIDIKKPGSFGNVILVIVIVIASIIALFSIFFMIKLFIYNRKKRRYSRSNIYTRRRSRQSGSQY